MRNWFDTIRLYMFVPGYRKPEIMVKAGLPQVSYFDLDESLTIFRNISFKQLNVLHHECLAELERQKITPPVTTSIAKTLWDNWLFLVLFR
jgi:hypothetical protein